MARGSKNGRFNNIPVFLGVAAVISAVFLSFIGNSL